MSVRVFSDKMKLGQAAARAGGKIMREALSQKETIAIVVATGASQFEMLSHLVAEPSIDWSRVRIFHLDEYIGLPMSHPASFRNYLMERLIVPLGAVGDFIPVNGDATDPHAEVRRLNALIRAETIEVCFAGIGENGHLAFNDPPADFKTTEPFLIVDLDEGCRRQQLGEGWFAALEDVPNQAISMSIHQIMKSRNLIVSVADARKADAVRATIEAPVSPHVPASILRQHQRCAIFLDEESASTLSHRPILVS